MKEDVGIRARPRLEVNSLRMGSRARAATDSAMGWLIRLGDGDYDASPPEFGGKVLGVSHSKSSSLPGSVQCDRRSAVNQTKKTLRKHK